MDILGTYGYSILNSLYFKCQNIIILSIFSLFNNITINLSSWPFRKRCGPDLAQESHFVDAWTRSFIINGKASLSHYFRFLWDG